MIQGLLLAAALCKPDIFRADGVPSHSALRGPGLVLSGGGLSQMPGNAVLRWMRARIAAPLSQRAGNLLILKASGERDYTDDFYRNSRFAFVQEILIPPCASRAQVNAIAPYVDRADAVLFAGGDQSHYTAWKGSALISAVRRVYARGGIVGGGSAGLAIQGQVVFDSAAADRILPDDQDVATPDAVKNPYEPAISFTTNLFHWPPMTDTITDTHVARRNRFGRLTAFMARALHDHLVTGNQIYGVAVDEGAALLVDANGIATLVQRPRDTDGYISKGAYIVRGGLAQRIRAGTPLRYTVNVTHLTAGQRYDLLTKHALSGTHYTVTIDGSAAHMYSKNPYN
jgi:cyanophycinase-like exopeptidase